MIQLTPRLLSIASHVKGKTAADIGTDHAYIPLYLTENNICTHVIAADIRRGPVDIARANIKKNNSEDKITVRMGSGLSVLSPNETEDIIIAGMGGELIEEILKADIITARASRLILQPMNSQYELRHYLIENNFKIVEEDIAVEGFKVYNIIIAVNGKSEPFLKDSDFHLPPYLKRHINYNMLYQKKMREFKKVIDGIKSSKEPDLKKLETYKKWLKECET